MVDETRLVECMRKAKLKFEPRAKEDLMTALRNFRNLRPEVRNYKFPDGIERLSLCITGTIAIKYKENTYHIPISLTILDNHPYSGPYCHVCPTDTMSIRVSSIVDQTGRIYLPYLTEWRQVYLTFTISSWQNFSDLMTLTFQDKTPVVAKPRQDPVPPSRPQPPIPSSYPTPYPMNAPYPTGPSSGMPQPYNAPQPNQPSYPPAASSYQAPYQPYTMQSPMTTPANLDQMNNSHGGSTPSLNQNTSNSNFGYNTIQPSHIRASLTSAIDDRLRQRLKDVMGTPYAELQSIDINLQELRTGNQKLREMIDNMEQESKRFSELKAVLEGKRKEFSKVLNECKSFESEDPDAAVDSAIDAQTPLHRQIVRSYVQDCAIDDTIYFLGQALKRGSINLQTYLKHVRQLSRKQFIHRATMQKARQTARLPV
ncbi:Tumor susceptibility transcribed protein [Aphelenchoides besseyi]|nr:Tumor susceptibility transcribed protein [Aphelenchoides besseyi]